MENNGRARCALFIDAENLIIGSQQAGLPLRVNTIVELVREEGVLVFAKAYGDWTQAHMRPHAMQFFDNVIEMSMVENRTGKNTADIQIVADALEMALLADSPDTFYLVTGDRDFVPLVQKLKRYGKDVVGIALDSTTAGPLARACNRFLYYDNLLPDAQAAGASRMLRSEVPVNGAARTAQTDLQPTAELRSAFELLLRAVWALRKQSRVAVGGVLRPLMQQMDSTFDLSRFRFESFREFVEEAQRHGYVRLGEGSGLDFSVEPLRKPEVSDAPASTLPLSVDEANDNRRELVQAYRAILQEKRVPLIPWHDRQYLVRHLWRYFDEHTNQSFTGGQMIEIMQDGAAREGIFLPQAAIPKLLFSLSLGQVFLQPEKPGALTDLVAMPMRPAVDSERALMLLNATYVRGLRISDRQIPLPEGALNALLHDGEPGCLPLVTEILEEIGVY